MVLEDVPMRFPSQFRMSVTRRGEKEQRLTAFIARRFALAGPGVGPGATPRLSGGICVLARSIDSPVVKAIGALAAEVAAARCAVRLLLVRSDRGFPALGCMHPQVASLDWEVRLARDPRLIEAHEQMVLGERTCWTGDSMRRDPAACDAYETFIDDCPEHARAAQATFERLWSAAEAVFDAPCTLPTGVNRNPLPLAGRG
jgi:hypothetical protein